ncbi:MAG TPA: TolC family protein [Verrucomicrobiae bacterium]|jgi:outer membrane protein TolC|nr:TolC family protein [Verrucomicrobiae bacterium]
MRTKSLLMILLLVCVAGKTASAQLTGSAVPASRTTDQPTAETRQSLPPSLDSFNGSGIVDKPVPGAVRLSLLDAMDRGIKHNLGLLLSQQQTESARAERWRNLSALLPHVSAGSSENVQKINLAAFGIPISINGSTLVGPFSVFDARATMSETLLDFNLLNKVRSSAESERAAKFSLQDARELVVLVVGDQYLLVLADAARLETAQAQLKTAMTILDRTRDMKAAGMAAGIDVLRAQVQMQAQQQRLLVAENQLERQKMVLARTIGLPVSQQIELSDSVPASPTPPLDLDAALARAYTRRPEYLAAQSRTRAAELTVKAAQGEALPTVQMNGDYGAIGRSPGSAEPTYTVAAGVRIPIFQGGRVRAEVSQARSELRQRQMQLEDLRSRVEFEVRSAWLDVKTSADQVEVARQTVTLAGEQLIQAQDRYAAGVAGTLDVVQAQEAVATANETYIQSLYLNNVAKLSLARALGVAEQQTREFLGGK